MKKITGLSIVCILVILIVIVYVSMADDSSATTNTLSEETVNFYEKWKNEYVIKNSYITNEDQYYVWYSGETYSQNNSATAVTVSEAHGYGMLITVSMADYDKDAKSIFDGMYRYYRAHLSSIGPNLMAWQQEDNGSVIVDTTGSDSATDGDMDIAYGRQYLGK